MLAEFYSSSHSPPTKAVHHCSGQVTCLDKESAWKFAREQNQRNSAGLKCRISRLQGYIHKDCGYFADWSLKIFKLFNYKSLLRLVLTSCFLHTQNIVKPVVPGDDEDGYRQCYPDV